MQIATKINSYNVYQDGKKLIGISDEVTLPDFEAMTETLSGAGLLGEIDEPLFGHFKSIEMEVPFRTMNKQMFNMASMSQAINLTLRISTQALETSTNKSAFLPSRIVVKGKNKSITGGKVKQGEGTGSSIKVEINYIMIEVEGKKVFELDKLNFKYVVNGKDLLAAVRKQV